MHCFCVNLRQFYYFIWLKQPGQAWEVGPYEPKEVQQIKVQGARPGSG